MPLNEHKYTDHTMSPAERFLKKGTAILEEYNLMLTPIAAATTHMSYNIQILLMPIMSSAANTSYQLLLTPAQWAGQFLVYGVPLISLLYGCATLLDVLVTKLDRYPAATTVRVLDFLFQLPLIIESYRAWGLTSWPLSLTMIAQGYAIQAGWDFLKAIADLVVGNGCNHEKEIKIKKQRCFLTGLKFLGFVLLSIGPPCFTAGFVCLFAAGLYGNSETVRNIAGSTLSFFAKCSPCCARLQQGPPREEERFNYYSS